jgi:hypothetical protein
MAAILFLPFEIRTGHFLTSLDRFGTKKIFFMTLYSKMVYASNRTFLSGFQMVWISNVQDWHKIESEYRPRFGIRWPTVLFSLWN